MNISIEKVHGVLNGIEYDTYYLVCNELNMRIKIKTNEKYAIDFLVNKCNNK